MQNRRFHRAAALSLALLALLGLTLVPYQTIREERIRAFGEEPARAVIIAAEKREGRFLLTYRYRGPEGAPRARQAEFAPDFWTAHPEGSIIEIYFAKGEPNLSRARFEREDTFRVWLRRAVRGDELPEGTKK